MKKKKKKGKTGALFIEHHPKIEDEKPQLKEKLSGEERTKKGMKL